MAISSLIVSLASKESRFKNFGSNFLFAAVKGGKESNFDESERSSHSCFFFPFLFFFLRARVVSCGERELLLPVVLLPLLSH